MSLGQRLLDLRKSMQLSQEEVADKLNVTRQTISKWETDGSTPDFDKIVPICKLYGISADELLTGIKEERVDEITNQEKDDNEIIKRKAKGIGVGILLYFVAIAWIMISVPVLMINPIVSSAIFILICGFATYLIVYTCIIYRKKKSKKEEKQNKLFKQIEEIISIFTVLIYLTISFLTMAWHITWLIWIVYALIIEIIKLIFSLRGDRFEK